jgi:hypothetical protein
VYRCGIDFNIPIKNKIDRRIFIGDFKMKVKVSKDILVKEFYYSFRNFVESQKYNILYWESLRIEEYYKQTYGNIKIAIDELKLLGLRQLFTKLNKLNIHHEIFFKFPRDDDQKKLLL